MTKEEILNGMSEEEFYQLYPTKEAWEQANQMKLGGLSGAPHNGQPTAAQFFNYGSHALDKFNIPFGHFAYGGGPIYPAQMGTQVNWPEFKTASEFDKFIAKDPNLSLYKPEDLQGLGLNRPAPVNLEAVKRQRAKATPYSPAGTTPEGTGLFKNAQGQTFTFQGGNYMPYTAPSVAINKKHGGMPCYECGGLHQAEYGFNSGVNYGSFSVPMQVGGDTTKVSIEMKKYLADVYNKEKGTNRVPLKDYPTKEQFIQQQLLYPDEIFSPIRGDKNIVNKYPNVKKEWYNRKQDGGALDASNNQMYPIFDFGGLKSIIDAATKSMKKAYGGNLTEQGGNQDFKKQYRSTFDNYIKKNTYNAIVDAEQQAIMDELSQMPYAQYGKVTNSEGYSRDLSPGEYRAMGYWAGQKLQPNQYIDSNNKICTAAGCFPNPHPGHVEPTSSYNNNAAQREAMANQIAQKQAQSQGFFGNFADMYAPSVGQNQMSVFGSLFPANFTRGYEFSNKDYARLKEMGDQGQITGITENYGPLARLLGKAGRRMFGPKSVTFGVMGPGSASEQQDQPVQNVGQGAYDNPLEGMESGQLFKDYNVGVTPVGKQHADFMPSNLWKQAKPSAGPEKDPWSELMNTPDTKAGPRAFQQGGNPVAYNEFTLKRKYSGQEDLWKYAPGAFNFLAAGIEQGHDRPEIEAAQLAMRTPGSNTGPFQSVPATGRRMGDYDPNSGMFRPNQMVPVQFPGGIYGYSQMGGELEEGEEAELSPEEIAELRAQGYEIEELD